MKKIILLTFLTISLTARSQTLIQSVNSGSVIAASSAVSVGEIVVVPQNQTQSSSGIIGILVQTLEVPQLELSNKITVFPNPTTAAITFQTETNLSEEKISVYNMSGQLVCQKRITSANTLDLAELATGVYLLQFSNKKINSFKIIKH